MKISFHCADQGVTGSCHLLECAGKRVLIDCGMYQGGRELVEENAEPFGFDPASIDFLLLTHAHLDHCGRIPLLVKRGFAGEIITTTASIELARLVLLDSAGLQEEEARYQTHRAKRRHGNHGEDIPVQASIHTIGGFSAHPDQAELLAWHESTGNPKTTFLAHGEDESMHIFAKKLKNTHVEMPALHQTFDLV